MSPGNCPAGCGRNVQAGKLLCGPCWSAVPRFLQQEVLRTWRAYQKAHRERVGLGGNDAIREARLAYQAARDNALASL